MSKENPLVHEIHVSEIREFKKCRFSHHLKFDEQYYPKVVAKPLEFGTAYHAAKEVYYAPETWEYPNSIKQQLAILAFKNTCNEQRDNLSGISEEQKQDYNERIELGVGMLEYYFGTLAPMLDINLEPLFVEKNFSIPIFNPSNGEQLYCWCNKCANKWAQSNPQKRFPGLSVHLEGKIDLVMRDKRTGKVWVLDWKTTARIADKHEWLELDEQVINYLVALHVLKLDVAGFQYHESLKTYPKPPNRNKTRRMGRMYSVDKNQDTDYDMYMETIVNGDPEGYESGAYDEFISWLEVTGKEFYHREIIRKDARHLELAQSDLYTIANEITHPARTLYASPSKYNCMYCDFQQVCIGRATLADYQYTLDTLFEKKAPYYEQ